MAAAMLQAFALATLLSAVSATITINLPLLPPITLFPSGCGRIIQIPEGATCQKLANDNGISLSQFQSLNPLTLCALPLLSLIPGNRICVGDNLSYCSDFYRSQPGDTCSSITNTLNIAGILSIDSSSSSSCSSLVPGTQVCLAPPETKCGNATISGIPISTQLQALLEMAPDYCSIVASGEGALSTSTYGNSPSLKLTLSAATPAVTAVVGKDGHPELRSFVSMVSQAPATLDVNFVPGGLADGSNLVDFAISAAGSSRRKLLGGYVYRGGARYPCCRYY